MKRKIKKIKTKGIEAAQTKLKKMRESGEITREYNIMKRAKADPKSKVKAIHAFCFNCMGGTIDELPDHGWKDGIRDCTAPECPLYNFRPFKPKAKSESKE
jgi:flagellar biosynthesis regulator FlaF